MKRIITDDRQARKFKALDKLAARANQGEYISNVELFKLDATRTELAEVRGTPIKCLEVAHENGFFAPVGAAEIQDWNEVLKLAVSAEEINRLMGWGIWDHAYLVNFGDYTLCYFVGVDEPHDDKTAAAAGLLGKKGRAVNSDAQKATAKANGKKGGRPKHISSTIGLNAYNDEAGIGGLIRFEFYSLGGGRIRIQPVKGLDLAKLSPVVDIPAEVFNARDAESNVDEFRFAAQLCGYRIGGEE